MTFGFINDSKRERNHSSHLLLGSHFFPIFELPAVIATHQNLDEETFTIPHRVDIADLRAIIAKEVDMKS